MLAYTKLSDIIICMILKGKYSKNNPNRLNAENISEACLDVIYDILIEPNTSNLNQDQMDMLLKVKASLFVVAQKARAYEKLVEGNLSLESRN